MSAAEAARLGDDVGHTSALAGLLLGALAAVAVAVAIIAIVGTGGVAAVAIGAGIAAGAAGGALAGSSIGELIPTSPTGTITMGAPNVLIENQPAARAGMDMAACSGVVPLFPHATPLIAQGSDGVYITTPANMAARKGDKLVCGGKVASGAKTVQIGGQTATVPGLKIDEDVPHWAKVALTVVMWAGAIIATGGAAAVVGWGAAICGFVGSVAGGFLGGAGGEAAGRWIGGKFGNAELGARIGGAIGGFAGALGGGMLGGAVGGRAFKPGGTITPEEAPNVGIKSEHAENLSNFAKDNNQTVIVRDPNPASLPHQGEPGTAPKPVALPGDAKTDSTGFVKWNSDKPPPAGYTTDSNGYLVDSNGNKMYSDYDMQGAYQNNPDGPPTKVDTNDPAYQNKINKAIDPEKPVGDPDRLVQHGANDNYMKGDKMGRQPGGDETYTAFEPDGTIRTIKGTGALQRYYADNGIPWPYKSFQPLPPPVMTNYTVGGKASVDHTLPQAQR